MNIIELKHLQKKYSPTTGCFDVNITVKAGEVYGFIGPNGAGKTTLIRQMVGFIKSDSGSGTILGYDIWNEADKIMNDLGYLAGEVSLPEYMTGFNYLKIVASLRKNVEWNYVEKLINYFDFSAKVKVKIKKMSKGMKQKVAIIAAFMHKPKILVLDEPTSGLDPLMQEKFNKLLEQTKKEGGSIFISSHIFGEIENTSDRVGVIKKGHIVSEVSLKELQMNADKNYELKFAKKEDYNKFLKSTVLKIIENDPILKKIKVEVPRKIAKTFLKEINDYDLDQYREVPFNLEDHFMKFYGDEVEFYD